MKRIIPILLLFLLAVPNFHAFGAEEVGATIMSPDKKTEIAANMRQAKHFMDKGNYVSAKKKLERVLELDAEHAEAQRLLAECNRMIEQQRQVEKNALDRAIALGTVKALQDFISQYPDSEYVDKAKKCIIDFELWSETRQKNTKAAYQQYLSKSKLKVYSEEANEAIQRIEADEAWNTCHNSNSIPKLEDFMKNYPNSIHADEAQYELNLLYAERCYQQNSRSLALSYYEKANATHALKGNHLQHYNELLTEEQYNKLKNSNDMAELQNFLRRLPTNSPYYNPISNRIAVLKAKRLSVYSKGNDIDEALRYAKDDVTRTTVKRYISEVKKRKREKARDDRRRMWEEWWEDRVTLGWNMIGGDVDPTLYPALKTIDDYPETCSLESGLRLRFGRYDDVFNITFGADYQNYWGKYISAYYYYGYYEEEDFYYQTIHRRVAFPVNLKFNMSGRNSNKAFYVGCSAEFGFALDDVIDYFGAIRQFDDFLNWQAEPSIAIEPQIGFNRKHFEWGLYYRHYLSGYRFMNPSFSDGNNRIGLFMMVYF